MECLKDRVEQAAAELDSDIVVEVLGSCVATAHTEIGHDLRLK
jgi:hypothetical protein